MPPGGAISTARVYELKVLSIAGRPTHIVIVPGWRTHPELNRVVALAETFRHGLAYRVRERVAALTGRVNAR